MSRPLATLTIDGKTVTVPQGTLIVDAAKRVGIEIPIFCYHPKLEPAGACRMCLVEIGRPKIDRATGQPVRDGRGAPVIDFGPKLETACTTPVGDGWVVRVNSGRALEGRRQVVEMLLTSHPLDCPICDKGGECPLQDLTLRHGPGQSRFEYDDKMHLSKRVPLGDLIVLDRERCIQCGRCVRFQADIAGDPVIAFMQRGRHLQIETFSDPGFDSILSGNTTDICPVGALTTVDFRFGSRPWELNHAASICPHCAVGCNIVLDSRREALSEGRQVVKRVMPRQNEEVNEIWICDKGRFGHHFAGSSERVLRPLARLGDQLQEVSWEKALSLAAEGLQKAGKSIVGVAGGRCSNEDLFQLYSLVKGVGGRTVLHSAMAGGTQVQQVGLGLGSNLAQLGAGDAFLVVATDLHQEAPIWWLRLKQAVARGAKLVVANGRNTRLDRLASYVLPYSYGGAARTVLGLLHAATGAEELAIFSADPTCQAAGRTLAEAANLVIFFGAEGQDYAGSQALAQACAALLAATAHVGRANNGLVAVWPHCNTQGAWDMGVQPHPAGLEARLKRCKAAIVMGADPIGDQALPAKALKRLGCLIVQELFLTETARMAHVVFPAQSFIERQGTYTSGERRVQCFYPAVEPLGGSKPDWLILAELGERVGLSLEGSWTGMLGAIASAVADYSGVDLQALTRVEEQWPSVGGNDLYFGGTAYPNHQGMGVKLASVADRGGKLNTRWEAPPELPQQAGLVLIPVSRLYDRGTLMRDSWLLGPQMEAAGIRLNPADAERLMLPEGKEAEVVWDGRSVRLPVGLEPGIAQGTALLTRSSGVALVTPVVADLRPVD